MKISIYSSLFNLYPFFPDYQAAISNFLTLADELVISTIKDKCGTYELLLAEAAKNDKIKVVLSDAVPFTPDFDGQLKEVALQECTGNMLIQLDMDERLSPNINSWKRFIGILNQRFEQALFVPSVNLYETPERAFDITGKWYVHKAGLHRGTVAFAKREDGTHDTTKSDSCELINSSGELVPTTSVCPFGHGIPSEGLAILIKDTDLPYVFHLGYLDLDRRVKLIDEFWRKQVSSAEGKEVELPKKVEEIKKESFVHNLDLWK